MNDISHDGSDNNMSVARYKADGTLDENFGVAGKFVADLSPTGDELNAVYADVGVHHANQGATGVVPRCNMLVSRGRSADHCRLGRT